MSYVCYTYLCVFIVNNWIKCNFNRVFLAILYLLAIVNIYAEVTEKDILLQYVKPLFIPVFVVFYLTKYRYINWYFVSFLCFMFLSDLTSVCYGNAKILQFSALFYFASYLSLLGFITTKFKGFRFGKFLAWYLIFVFILNTYLLYQLYTILDSIMLEPLEVLFFGLRSAALALLVLISFAVYLSSESKSSILYLLMALCFVFSDLLYYIHYYYIYDISFVLFDKFLFATGLICLFYYLSIRNEAQKRAIKIRSYNFVFEKQQQVVKH